MTSNEPQTQREKEPNAVGASMAWGCQPCTPRRARATKSVPEQDMQEAGDQATAASPEMSAACCADCDCGESDERPGWQRCGRGDGSSGAPAAEAGLAPPIVRRRRSRQIKGSAGPRPAREE